MTKKAASVLAACLLAAISAVGQERPAGFQDLLRKGDVAGLAAAIDKDPSIVNRPDAQGMPPLFWAAMSGQAAIAELLLSRGADPRASCPAGTAVHGAVHGGRPEMVAVLVSGGADPDGGGSAGRPPLVLASQQGKLPLVDALLGAGASVAAVDRMGNSAVLMAASHGHEPVVRRLLSKRANLNAANSYGDTPLDVARRQGHAAVAAYLEAQGAAGREARVGTNAPFVGQLPPGPVAERFAPSIVSTERRELNAAFLPDGRTAFFSRDRESGGTVIMMTSTADGPWTAPEPAPFSRGGHSDVDMFVTADGREIYFCSDRPVPGMAAPPRMAAPPAGGAPPPPPPSRSGIWVVTRTAGGWGEPVWLGPAINSGAEDYYPTLTRTGALYFSSNRPGGLGQNDIYVARRADGTWAPPRNLGPPVSSEFREFDPFIAPDESYVIFASNRPGGLGGSDLYLSVRSATGEWGEPKNLGPAVNSPASDYTPMLSPDGKYLFFTSGRDGQDDLFWIDAGVVTALLPQAVGTTRSDIHDAALKGDLQTVKDLLAREPAVVDVEKAPNKKTALHYAAQGAHRDVVELLLDNGAQVDRPNIAGETPLHYAMSAEKPDVALLLMARGANPAARTTAGRSALSMATAWRRLATIRALIERGADPQETLPDGQTLLHVSAVNGPAEAIAIFVSKGVAVDASSKNGETPLLAACTAGNMAAVKAILDHGADPNRRDAAGRYPLDLAVRTGRAEFVKLLLDAGARPDAAGSASRRGALHTAAALGYRSIVEMLLARGADRHARDSQGNTPLDLATAKGNAGVVAALESRPARSRASRPQATVTPPLLRPLKEGQATVWYLGHLGWAIKTAHHFLVFDYDGRVPPPEEPSLAGGWINPEEIKDLPTVVFISHDHADHYAPAVFAWKSTVKDITYVAGFKPEGKDGYVFMAPRETKTLGGLDITTTMANDAGVGFFVKVDGVAIFHAGDHAAWEGEDGTFRPEIDFLAGRGLRPDLLFMPVSIGNNPSMNEGVRYAITRLDAAATFPGHGRGREHVYAEFAREAVHAGITRPIHCAEMGGDHFSVEAVSKPVLAVANRPRSQIVKPILTTTLR